MTCMPWPMRSCPPPNTPVVVSSNDPCNAFNNVTDDNRASMAVALGQFGQEMEDLVTQMIGNSGKVNWTASDIDGFCNASGLPRNAILDGDIVWQAVETAFLKQAQTAFASRQMGTDDQCSPYFVGYPYPKGIIQNAILATMKLLICAAPYDAQPIAAPDQVRAIPVDNGVDVVWEPVTGALATSCTSRRLDERLHGAGRGTDHSCRPRETSPMARTTRSTWLPRTPTASRARSPRSLESLPSRPRAQTHLSCGSTVGRPR